METEGTYASRLVIHRCLFENDERWGDFGFIKRRLFDSLGFEFFEGMIGDDLHHVLKFDIMKDEQAEQIAYYLKIRHSVARMRTVTFAKMPDMDYSIPFTAKKVCGFCGNIFVMDKRGGCSACGGFGSSAK